MSPPQHRPDALEVGALLSLVEAERRAAAEAKAASAAQALQNEELRGDLLRLVHDTATPLTALIGMLELLAAEHPPTDEAPLVAQRALRQAQHLREVLDDVAVDLTVEPPVQRRAATAAVAVAQVIDDAMDTAAAALASRPVAVEGAEGTTVQTVPSRLRDILVNLLVNAAKYSAPGSPIDVVVRQDAGATTLSVADRGGADAVHISDELFEPYARHEAHAAAPGSGLGLYLVRRSTAALGGTVVLIPRSGGGTIAVVRLPRRRSED